MTNPIIPPGLSKKWIAERKGGWESNDLFEEITFKNPVGYYTASRYAFRKYGICNIRIKKNED